MPRLVFVLDENAVLPLPQVFLSDPVFGERQLAFRERVQDAGITVQRVDSPDRLETLLFQALTTLQQAPGGRGGRGAAAGGGGPGLAVRLAARPVFLAGREELLAGLDARLAGRGAGPGVVVLCGLGGAGKTSVAVEYAYRQADRCAVVWQLPAEDPAGLAAGFAGLAAHLGIGAGGGDTVGRVHAVLARRDDWLLVFDNVPGPAAVAGLVPPAGGGRVVITSQFGSWPGRAGAGGPGAGPGGGGGVPAGPGRGRWGRGGGGGVGAGGGAGRAAAGAGAGGRVHAGLGPDRRGVPGLVPGAAGRAAGPGGSGRV